MINKINLEKLIREVSNDKERFDIVYEGLISFEEYHDEIFFSEIARLYGEKDEYIEKDKARTIRHNKVISVVGILNRFAEEKGIGKIYDGVISREQPYRRELADSVLDYVSNIIRRRI